jgi:hypothetical protein
MTKRAYRSFLLAGVSLALLALSGCRGPHKPMKIPASRYIAVHREVREAMAAFEAKNSKRLTRVFDRLGEINDQPSLLSPGEGVRVVELSPGGRYLIVGKGETLGGAQLLIFEAKSARLLLGLNGYGAGISSDDRWLALLQHRYATPEPDADVGTYEAILLVDLGRVRGASPDDNAVFQTIVTDLEGKFMRARTTFLGNDRIALVREKPALYEEFTLQGKSVPKHHRRWIFLKLH